MMNNTFDDISKLMINTFDRTLNFEDIRKNKRLVFYYQSEKTYGFRYYSKNDSRTLEDMSGSMFRDDIPIEIYRHNMYNFDDYQDYENNYDFGYGFVEMITPGRKNYNIGFEELHQCQTYTKITAKLYHTFEFVHDEEE